MLQTPPVDSIDGIRLDGFHAGAALEVGNTIGALLLAEGWAEPVPFTTPDIPAAAEHVGHPPNLVRDDDQPYFHQQNDSEIAPRDVAADSNRRRRDP